VATVAQMNPLMGLEAAIEARRELVRRGEITKSNGQGGYTILGSLVEIRYERTPDHGPMPEHLRFDVRGCVIDWVSPKTAPLVGLDRAKTQLLVVSHVPPLPDIADPSFRQVEFITWNHNRIPLASVPPEMRDHLKNQDGSIVRGTDRDVTKPKMIKQRFVDHCCGSLGEFMVFRPITEALVKLSGIVALQKILFSKKGRDWPGFYLNADTGEGHFLGGHSELGGRHG